MSQIFYNIVQELMNRELHIRALAKKIGINQMTIARKAKELEELNVLDFRFEGKNKVYAIKNSIEAKLFVKKTEYNKAISAVQRYPRLRLVFEKMLSTDLGLAVLFGSYARADAGKESDIDLYIETSDQSTKRIVEQLDSKISVKYGKFDKESALGKEIIKNHIIIRGVDRYYELVP